MLLMILPYALQLLCIIHMIKTHQNTIWIWILIFLPYVGGLAYLFVEILPPLFNRNRIDTVTDSVSDFIKPSRKLETLKQQAMYSSTFKNMIAYGDALVESGSYDEAITIFNDQNEGAFLNDPELLYRIANALNKKKDYTAAFETISELFSLNEKRKKSERETLLHLSIIEKVEKPEKVKAKYQNAIKTIQSNAIEIPYVQFLIKIKDHDELEKTFQRIKSDEQSMKANKIKYDKKFYKTIYLFERDFKK